MSPLPTRSAQQVRSTFLDYFKGHGHEVVASGPLVPSNDPTLMFANAGMVPFKDCFTGRETRSYKRAASSQKCIRISGKHNDLENVGRTARHHTFFEMLGNFSFGDYFKEEAIVRAWELVTKVYEVPRDRLVVTYFAGADGIAEDSEAKALWKKISGLGDDRLIGLGMADNFWSMGDTGPCGPCSEIHYRHGKDSIDPRTFGEEPGADGMGWMEIWNLVFMQFERFADGAMKPLPAPSVDTGMGLERITSVVQGVTTNYDTDLLRALVEKAATISGKRYGGTMSPDDVSMRVIADHARTTAFLIAEGVFPDRAGREYVLRRVMRRAIRHGHRLGIKQPFLHEVASEVIALMGDSYGELRTSKATILEVAESEEVRFRATIDRGLELIEKNEQWETVDGKKTMPGEVAFRLADTFGFPLDLTQVIGSESGFEVDEEGFKRALVHAKELSAGSKLNASAAIGSVYHALATDLAFTPEFVGYTTELATSEIVAIVKNGARVESLSAGEEGEIVTRATPFYAESGGQVGDCGEIRSGATKFTVTDTRKPVGGLVVHAGALTGGALRVGDAVELEIDHDGRSATRRNHSATHLVHYALRTVLGEHVQQKGSLVGPDRLRFDYAHGKAITDEQLAKIEQIVNEMVLDNAEIVTEVLPIAEARAKGAMAIFGEKYGGTVRVLSMGARHHTSIELCGGTHARRTGDIGLFRVVSDRAIAAGVRRMEATTGFNSMRETRAVDHALAPILKALNSDATTAQAKLEKLLATERTLEKKIAELEKQLALGGGNGAPGGSATGGIDAMLAGAKSFAGFKALAVKSSIGDAGALREFADQLRDKLGSHGEAIVMVAAAQGGKASIVVTVTKGFTSRAKAGELIRPIAAIVGGSGGGRPDMAQAGGTEVGKIDAAIDEFYARMGVLGGAQA